MKYLKRFNEELKSSTYMSASRKLKKMGHHDRAEELKDWAIETERKEEMVKWERNLNIYKPFGTFKMNIKNPETGEAFIGEFYLDIHLDCDAFSDYPEGGFTHFIGITPTSKETIDKCNKMMPDAEMGNGFYWSNVFTLNYEIVNDKVEFTKFELDNYDEYLSGEVSFADRASANKFKNLMIKIYSDPKLGYPSGYTDVTDMYEKLSLCILSENSFSSDYGFELENIAEYIKTISPNLLYKA